MKARWNNWLAIATTMRGRCPILKALPNGNRSMLESCPCFPRPTQEPADFIAGDTPDTGICSGGDEFAPREKAPPSATMPQRRIICMRKCRPAVKAQHGSHEHRAQNSSSCSSCAACCVGAFQRSRY